MMDFKFLRRNRKVRYIGGQCQKGINVAPLILNKVYTVSHEANMINRDGSIGELCYYLEEMNHIKEDNRSFAFAKRLFVDEI